jgi:hypothetical protein
MRGALVTLAALLTLAGAFVATVVSGRPVDALGSAVALALGALAWAGTLRDSTLAVVPAGLFAFLAGMDMVSTGFFFVPGALATFVAALLGNPRRAAA